MLREITKEELVFNILKGDIDGYDISKIVKDTIEWEDKSQEAPFRISSFKMVGAFHAELVLLKWDKVNSIRIPLDASFDAFSCEGRHYAFFKNKWHWVTPINKTSLHEIGAAARQFKQQVEQANQ